MARDESAAAWAGICRALGAVVARLRPAERDAALEAARDLDIRLLAPVDDDDAEG